MRSWSITEARAYISGVFDAALKSGPQKIERRDSEPVVMIAESDWKRLVAEYPTMAELVLKSPVEDDDGPKRRRPRAVAKSYF
jgi:hypothetical protein